MFPKEHRLHSKHGESQIYYLQFIRFGMLLLLVLKVTNVKITTSCSGIHLRIFYGPVSFETLNKKMFSIVIFL